MLKAYVPYLVPVFFTLQLGVADAADFETIWSAIEARSPALKSEASGKEAAEVLVSRSKGHWVPRLLLNAGVVSTNDPGTTLFSTLGSRSLEAADLSPSLMNHPSRQWFKSGNAVLDWTLFEGGARQSAVKGALLMSESQSLTMAARKNEVYAELVQDFGKLAALNTERSGVIELKEKLSRLVERYKVGSKDNPVGYSGLLGMRSLINRLESVLSQNSAEADALVESMRIRSGLGSIDRSTQLTSDPVDFAKEKFKKNAAGNTDSSLRVESMRLMAAAQTEYSMAERAKWLPRVGLFARENLVSGPRDTGTSTDYGAYLQWAIFDASNIGAYREASLRSKALEYHSSEMAEKSEVARRGLHSSLPMLEGNLKRVKESIEITSEQVSVTEKLFKNGSVNALQLAEVLSRRADVIENRKQVEIAYLDQLTEAFLQNVSAP